MRQAGGTTSETTRRKISRPILLGIIPIQHGDDAGGIRGMDGTDHAAFDADHNLNRRGDIDGEGYLIRRQGG